MRVSEFSLIRSDVSRSCALFFSGEEVSTHLSFLCLLDGRVGNASFHEICGERQASGAVEILDLFVADLEKVLHTKVR